MNKRTLSALVLLVITALAHAQLRDLSLSDAVLKAGTDYAPQRLAGLQWIPNTTNYSYTKGDSLMMGSIGKMADRLLLRTSDLEAQMKKDNVMKRFPGIEWENTDRFHFVRGNAVYVYDRKNAKLNERTRCPDDAENMDLEATTGRVAFTHGQNLFVAEPGAPEAEQVTRDSVDGHVNGVSVHRQEYGITKGTFWSPAGNLLAFYRMDESMVTTYQLEDIATKPSTFSTIRYPMAGQTSHHVRIGIYDTRTKSLVHLATGDPLDQYLTNIAWDPSEQWVYVTHLDRKTENLKLVRYSVKTGAAAGILIEEHNDKYLEPEHAPVFLQRTAGRYIWWSERDGWQHLYLYDVKAGLVRQLTSGRWVVKEIVGIDEKETALIVEGTGSDPRETHVYRVPLGGGPVTRLTREPGTHSARPSKDGHSVIDEWSSLAVPGRTEVLDAVSGRAEKTLLISPDPLRSVKHGTVAPMTVIGENNDTLYARLIKPADFDPSRKYPVIVYLYNGPHVQLVTNSFLGGASLWMLHAAERGYLVFTVDGHGSENRGLAFEQAIHRQLGVLEVKDQLHGVDFLKSLPYVDTDRMAVHGWSFGGHVTVGLMLRSPDTFKAAVAGGPVMDWAMYEVMYTERYMDTPAENPDGYALTRHTDKASGLKGDLLIIHGGQDDTVLPEHSLAFLKNCVDNGVQVDFFEYPGHAHNVRGKDRLHLMTKVLGYFDEKLGVH